MPDWRGFVTKDQLEANVLHQAVGSFLPLLDLPTAHPDFFKVRNYIVGIACQDAGVMNALLTCGALLMSTEDDIYIARSLQYYSQSIVNFQKNVKHVQSDTRLSEAMLDTLAVNSWGEHTLFDHRCHILGACRIYQFRLEHLKDGVNRSRNSRILQRIESESIIHQVCLMQLALPILDDPEHNVILETLWPSIEAELATPLFGQASWSPHESPVLGLPWQIYKLAYDANTTSIANDPEIITFLLRECDIWKQRLEAMALNEQTSLQGRLHLSALSILLYSKLLQQHQMNESLHSMPLDSHEMSSRPLQDALSILEYFPEFLSLDDTFHGIICLIILKKNINDAIYLAFIENVLNIKWEKNRCHQIRRLMN
ncbi:uncharacterized protein N7496_003178 [Penicillium cataractarum]|uniref:Uncharacterized protein n=1 Tax=Penicillium cataractarum TaxID=2100454 RepID=A0A9W9SLT7_9EURO|nr:uncharacterized protein N7496_003178 [Penicillium cataractarum]KAJ5380750.1 hypothetical protein N7496_003178 [Penicillium cataractarum]